MAKADWHHLYNTAQWKQLRSAQLLKEPLCKYCMQAGRIAPANTVDHRIAHKGNRDLFFDAANLDSTCKLCHDSTKAKAEHRGYVQGCDREGMPLDASHHWN